MTLVFPLSFQRHHIPYLRHAISLQAFDPGGIKPDIIKQPIYNKQFLTIIMYSLEAAKLYRSMKLNIKVVSNTHYCI